MQKKIVFPILFEAIIILISFHQLHRLQNVRQRSRFCPGMFLFLLIVLCEATKSVIFKSDISLLGCKSLSSLPRRHLRSSLPTLPRRCSTSSEFQPINGGWGGGAERATTIWYFLLYGVFPTALSQSDKKVDDNTTESSDAHSKEAKLWSPTGSIIRKILVSFSSDRPSVGFLLVKDMSWLW